MTNENEYRSEGILMYSPTSGLSVGHLMQPLKGETIEISDNNTGFVILSTRLWL